MKGEDTYSDEQLLILLREGQYHAFTEIFNRYWKLLLDVAYRRLKTKEAAEEVVQEVFVSLYLRREQLQPASTLEAYLKTALKYKVIDAYRRQQLYYKHLEGMISASMVHYPDPEETQAAKDLWKEALRTAEILPQKCQEVFVLSRVEQLSHQEIAERLHISVATVKSHLNKALKVIRERLGPHAELILVIFFCMN